MAEFKYKAKDASGKTVKGYMAASDRNDLVKRLRAQRLIAVDVKEKRSRNTGGGGGFFSFASRPSVKKGELELFTRQLSTMVSSGIPLLECLAILQEQAESPGFRKVITSLIEDIQSGTDLSAAMSKFPRVFTEIYVSMVRAGEASGQLDEILTRLAEYLEASAALKREIKSAMTYPVVSLVMVLAITAFLMMVIVPKFKEIFSGIGVELPGFTMAVMNASDFMRSNSLGMLVGCIGACVAISFWKRTPSGRSVVDHVLMRTPVFGKLFQKVALSRFSRTFSTLIKSGVPILASLEIVAETSGNSIVSKAVRSSLVSVRSGETLAEPLSEHWIFPPMVTRMIGIGERSGALEALLAKIAEFYDQQVEAEVKSLTSLIEPLMIGFMGVLVGGIVMAVFLPILKLQSTLTPGG